MFWTKNNPQKFMSKRVIDALKANFSEHELVELSRVATPIEIAAGTPLTLEGTLGQQAVIVIDGTASVTRDGEHVATINPGEIIGEIALLSGEPRTATVIADSDCLIYAMSPRGFNTLLARCPRLEKRMTTLAVRRLSEVG